MTSTRAAPQRKRGGWTMASKEYLEQVQCVIEELRDYWPLTLRQVYYRLVVAEVIDNKRAEYQKLSRILVKARLDELVPWEALEDRSRILMSASGWKNSAHFVETERGQFLRGYRRDLLQRQGIALEVWIEKDALAAIVHRVAFEYCVPVVVARGFSSVSFVHECRRRVLSHRDLGRRTVLLYFGDLDPSGWAMLPTMLETLQEEMGLGNLVEGKHCALTPEQVEEHELPHNPDALKKTDTRAQRYIEQFGDLAVELDALPPSVLEEVVRQNIESELDLDLFRAEQEAEATDVLDIEDRRERVHDWMESELG